MPKNFITKVAPLAVFYKSTLTLSIGFASMMSIFGLASLSLFIQLFSMAHMSGGTLCSLLYKELTLKNEYYFYYNLGISKTTLMLTCCLVNILIGAMLIVISRYV
ncbi:MAG: hypothetical protein JWP78_204 [Mucilaginibacter sp.]|nr:hypothetical protein [Mucilaginibacter sp.]